MKDMLKKVVGNKYGAGVVCAAAAAGFVFEVIPLDSPEAQGGLAIFAALVFAAVPVAFARS